MEKTVGYKRIILSFGFADSISAVASFHRKLPLLSGLLQRIPRVAEEGHFVILHYHQNCRSHQGDITDLRKCSALHLGSLPAFYIPSSTDLFAAAGFEYLGSGYGCCFGQQIAGLACHFGPNGGLIECSWFLTYFCVFGKLEGQFSPLDALEFADFVQAVLGANQAKY